MLHLSMLTHFSVQCDDVISDLDIHEITGHIRLSLPESEEEQNTNKKDLQAF